MAEPLTDATAHSASAGSKLETLRRWLSSSSAPSHSAIRSLYLRLLGGIYLIAFLSLWSQINGLIGSHGILPITQYLAWVGLQVGPHPWHVLPTFCWWSSTDLSLQVQCAAGAALSVLMIIGIAPALTLVLMWLLYLSLSCAGQSFLSFQWDYLLLEAGFLATFFSPLVWLLHRARQLEPAPVVLWLQRWLIFRLMVLSGLCKYASGDTSWRDGSAMSYHYQTQPLPTWTSWYINQQPRWMVHASTELTMAFELVIPLLMLGPRRLRHIAFAITVLLQALILATGNYGFFNLLAIVLCLPLLDDAALDRAKRLFRRRPRTDAVAPLEPATAQPASAPQRARALNWPLGITVPLAILIGLISIPEMFAVGQVKLFHNEANPLNVSLQGLQRWVEPFRSINGYGLFANMTRSRPEIILQTSDDRIHWTPVSFRWKPGDVTSRPRFCTPHMPRLDWQMWFAALDWQDNSDVLGGVVRGILRGDKPVLGLLAPNDFAAHPPRYVRAVFFDYSFTTFAQKRQTGAWWKRVATGGVTPAYSLQSLGEGAGDPSTVR